MAKFENHCFNQWLLTQAAIAWLWCQGALSLEIPGFWEGLWALVCFIRSPGDSRTTRVEIYELPCRGQEPCCPLLLSLARSILKSFFVGFIPCRMLGTARDGVDEFDPISVLWLCLRLQTMLVCIAHCFTKLTKKNILTPTLSHCNLTGAW